MILRPGRGRNPIGTLILSLPPFSARLSALLRRVAYIRVLIIAEYVVNIIQLARHVVRVLATRRATRAENDKFSGLDRWNGWL
jgi:hypothetical protein